MEKKYKINKNISVEVENRILFYIIALRDFGNVKAGDVGGYIEKEENLSQHGTCWVYHDARVYNDAHVYGDAWIYDSARVCGDVKISSGCQ